MTLRPDDATRITATIDEPVTAVLMVRTPAGVREATEADLRAFGLVTEEEVRSRYHRFQVWVDESIGGVDKDAGIKGGDALGVLMHGASWFVYHGFREFQYDDPSDRDRTYAALVALNAASIEG